MQADQIQTFWCGDAIVDNIIKQIKYDEKGGFLYENKIPKLNF